MKRIAFGSIAASFLEHLRELNFAASTIRGHVINLHIFLDYLGAVGVSDIRNASRETLWNYALMVQERPWAPQTKHQKIMTVKKLFRFLHRQGCILVDPSPVLPEIKVPDSLPRVVLTRDEANLILAQPDVRNRLGFRDRAILEVLYSTAIRRSELLNLTIFDVDLVDGVLRINQGKGRKDRIVPLGKVAGRILAEYLRRVRPRLAAAHGGAGEGQPALFLSQRGGRLSGNALECLVHGYAKRAAVGKRVTCHTFRHTCATEMLRGGSSIRHVQELLGHVDISTTQIYTRLLPLDLVKAHSKAHPRERQRSVEVPAPPADRGEEAPAFFRQPGKKRKWPESPSDVAHSALE